MAEEPLVIPSVQADQLIQKYPGQFLESYRDTYGAPGQNVVIPRDEYLGEKSVRRAIKRESLSNRQKALQARFMPKYKQQNYIASRQTANYLGLSYPPRQTKKQKENYNFAKLLKRVGAAAEPLNAYRAEGEKQLKTITAQEGRFRGSKRSHKKNKVSLAARLASEAMENPSGYNWSAFSNQSLLNRHTQRYRKSRRLRKTRRNRK